MIVARYTDWRHICAPGAPLDAAGYETWPHSALLFPPGDAGMNLVLPLTLTTLGTITTNGQAVDATNYVDEFDWYLSQRTDDPAAQSLGIVQLDLATNTRSGTVQLYPTPLAQHLYGVSFTSPIPSADIAALLFKDVWLYVRRRSDGRIMWGHFLPTAS